MRGISAVRVAEIPRLRLGMTRSTGLMLVPVAAMHVVACYGAEKVRRYRCLGLRQFLLARLFDRTHLDHETQGAAGQGMVAVKHRDRVGEVGYGVDAAILWLTRHTFDLHADRDRGAESHARDQVQQTGIVIAEGIVRLEPQRGLEAGLLSLECALNDRKNIVGTVQ